MYFIDFEHLKVVKDFHYTTIERELNITEDSSLLEMQDQILHFVKEIIDLNPLAVNYVIDVTEQNPSADFMLTITNIITAIFFNNIITDKGWKREYRLDVPEKLKGLHTSMSSIKKAVNRETINHVFNLTIKCGDFIYYLCDEKDFKDENIEFLHSTDELEDK